MELKKAKNFEVIWEEKHRCNVSMKEIKDFYELTDKDIDKMPEEELNDLIENIAFEQKFDDDTYKETMTVEVAII